MRILLINYEYPPLGGGGGVASKKLAEEYVRQGHIVDCVTSGFQDLPKSETINNVKIYRASVIGKRDQFAAGLLTLLSFPLCAFRLTMKLCKKNNYDIIDTHFAVPSGPLGIAISKIKKIPLNLFIYGADIYDPTKKYSPHRSKLLRAVVDYVLSNSTRVIAESSDIKQRTEAHYSFSGNIEIIPVAYDTINFSISSREDLKLSDDKKYLISVGRLVKRKDFGTLIKTLTELNNNIEVLIIGDGPELDNLKELAKQLDLEKRVHFLGFVSEEEKFRYLNASDIYVLSSLHEGFGIVLQEAMQVGLPVIATNYGGQIDLIEDGVNGFLVDVGDYQAIANKVRMILSDNVLAENLSKMSLKELNKYSASNIVKKIISKDKETKS